MTYLMKSTKEASITDMSKNTDRRRVKLIGQSIALRDDRRFRYFPSTLLVFEFHSKSLTAAEDDYECVDKRITNRKAVVHESKDDGKL